jgi:hypothetical protein
MADAAGTVDLSRDAPVGGDYAEVSAMGLVWAQYPAPTSQDMFVDDVREPLVTELAAATSDVAAELRDPSSIHDGYTVGARDGPKPVWP